MFTALSLYVKIERVDGTRQVRGKARRYDRRASSSHYPFQHNILPHYVA
jgi:hypothetical protein